MFNFKKSVVRLNPVVEEATIDTMLKEYLELQEQEDLITKKKNDLKKAILTEMGDEKKYKNDFASATVSVAQGFKYTDEVGMIRVLKENGYGAYVKEKVDTSLNKVLKENTPLTESLKGMYVPTSSEKLTVSKA